MHTHANARLTQKARLRLIFQHLNSHRPLAELAAEAGISLRCAYKWLARYRSGGPAALADRRSVRRQQRRTLDSQHLQRAVELRDQRLHLRHIARLLAAPFSTVARALNRLGLGRLRNLDPKPPVQRYERERPGDLIHIDVKKLAHFRKVGHRITGNRQQGTPIGFLSRALAWFNGHGVECRQVMSDNGSAYISKAFAKACSVLKLKHIRTRPYTPRTNGKAERFIQTLCKEWAYAMPFQNSQERNAWMPRYLSIYNRLRKHSALSGRSPQQRLHELLC